MGNAKPEDKPRRIVRITRELIGRFYDKKENVCGGVLHITTDDYNINDSSINFCLKLAKEKRDGDAIRIANNLMSMTMHERAECLGLDTGSESFAFSMEQQEFDTAQKAKS